MYNPFSIGGATGTDDKQQPMQGSMGLTQAYHSQPIAGMPQAQAFHPIASGASAPIAPQQPQQDWTKVAQGLGQNLKQGMQTYNQLQGQQTRQGLLADPLATGQNGGTPMPPGYDPNAPQPFMPDPNAAAPAAPPVDPNLFQNPFSMMGGLGMGGMFGGLY